MTVTVDVARDLLDMGARLRAAAGQGGSSRANEQLEGAVAIHNILETQGVAYLADEVGMGKTYVALGAIALLRHFNPMLRVAVIAPRENIQTKWMKEWHNFATHIVRVPDLRMKGLHGGPARDLVPCNGLQQFVRETTVDPDREFFLRMSSFSLGAGGEEADLRALRAKFERELPWAVDAIGNLRSKKQVKDDLAKTLCCALPTFDLLVVDEAHNLKHGFSDSIASRNRVMAFAFGRPSPEVDKKTFRDYGVRAKRVLFLSATPIEDDYRQLWNQLDVFGKGAAFTALADPSTSESQKQQIAKQFLVRRVTSLPVCGQDLTKNLYRREWRRGGVASHDEPIRVDDVRQRLVVALIQKKVAELLNTEKFGASFQMGMLASFESFLETANLQDVEERGGNFDDAEQTEDDLEREGIDVNAINALASDYRKRFHGEELPHPKMDALVAHLEQSWRHGRKSLVFLRRVASVWEIKERLDRAYNAWLFGRIEAAFSANSLLLSQLAELRDVYDRQRDANRRARLAARMTATARKDGEQDRGGDDTFFAWFFRGRAPEGRWLSGSTFSQRFIDAGYELSTFFEDNYVADLLQASPSRVLSTLRAAVDLDAVAVSRELADRAGFFLTQAKEHGRRERFDAAQAAALELLAEKALDEGLRRHAGQVLQQRFVKQHVAAAAGEIGPYLEIETFFSVLRQPRWRALRTALWPEADGADVGASFRDSEVRRVLLATLCRLGHPIIDVYVTAMRLRGTLSTEGDGGRRAPRVAGSRDEELVLIEAVLAVLADQQQTPIEARGWGAFDELSQAAEHLDLILDVNEPKAREVPLAEIGRLFGALLRQQQPVGGMTGEVTRTLVRQFRMPGYPFVLLSTDLLQEGEDLHTFCAEVHHYGLAWTPSAVEQRIGRVDRVRSMTERRAMAAAGGLSDDGRLQVFFPHLEDTVERLQVRRVLRRMHEFLRLMHEGLTGAPVESSRLHVATEILNGSDLPAPIATKLTTSFPVESKHLAGRRARLAVDSDAAEATAARLQSAKSLRTAGELTVAWDESTDGHSLVGTATNRSGRRQDFVLHLDSFGEHIVVRCVSVVGHLDYADLGRVQALSKRVPEQFGIICGEDERGFDLTVEEEVLLGRSPTDAARMQWLVRRVVATADRVEAELWDGADLSLPNALEMLRTEGRVVHADRR